jgi:phosphoglycolate phosphatase-like HAD superfamily hydrolase
MPDHDLILFDIDATLVTTTRAGIHALGDAGRELYGERFTIDGVDYAGRLDPLIIRDLLAVNAVDPSEASVSGMRQGYLRHLAARLGVPGTARALPGVPKLIQGVRSDARFVTGLLTGNFPESGRLKLGACGIDADGFEICVWGCDSPHEPPDRSHLPAVALTRYQDRYGTALAGERVTIIGDTPHDVACARAHGCRCLAVATGMFDVAALAEAGADRVVSTLEDTEDILTWLRGI